MGKCVKKPLVLSDVWRTCNKVRAAVFRGGVDLWAHYRPHDPNNNCLISESKFISVLSGPLKHAIGLSDQEIAELTDYFRVSDGRVLYTQFCEVIHDSVPDFSKNKPLTTGLEWEDPFQCNVLSVSEERRLLVLITKIAALVNMRRLVLRPYFQDYELISKNTGVVTLGHFARVLHYLNILVSAEDYQLLVKKFIKDSYTINYVAFVQAIDTVTKYMDDKCMLDVGGDVLMQYPGKALTAELPKLPRPEIGKVNAAQVFGKQNVFHPVLNSKREDEDLEIVLRRIQSHVFTNRIRVGQFFQGFDMMNSGRVTISQFRRSLDGVGLAGLSRLYLSESELNMLLYVYRDPNDPTRMCWKTFEDDIDQVFTTKSLEKMPGFKMYESPPLEVAEVPRKGRKNWQQVDPITRDLCEEALDRLKRKTSTRGILLKPAFNAYDPHNNGHVSRPQFRQCLLSNGVLCSEEELFALEQRFNDDLGFNYFWFFKELEPRPFEEPLYNSYLLEMKRVNEEKRAATAEAREHDIVEILAKIKGKAVRERIRVAEFMRDFDTHNEGNIARQDFVRGLDCCRFDLTCVEMETIMDVFASPMRRERVDFKRFCQCIEEAFSQSCLERAPLIVPLQHLAIADGEKNFLNFEERQIVSLALEKLAKPRSMNLESIFDDYDRTHCGLITGKQFKQALTVRNMSALVSGREMELVEKCFAVERGVQVDFDYRAFLRAIEMLQAISNKKPF